MNFSPAIKRLSFLLFLALAGTPFVQAQEVEDLRYRSEKELIVISYRLNGKIGPYQSLKPVPHLVWNKGGDSKPFKVALSQITGDIRPIEVFNARRKISAMQEIKWQVFQDSAWKRDIFPFPAKDSFYFEILLDKKPLRDTARWALALSGNTAAPLGLTLYRLSRWGAYLSAKMLPLPVSVKGESENSGRILQYNEFYRFTGNKRANGFTLSAGIIRRWGVDKYVYAGAGYGASQLLWETQSLDGPDPEAVISTQWAANQEKNYSGLLLEVGTCWQYGKFLADIGAGLLDGKRLFANFGLGIVLR